MTSLWVQSIIRLIWNFMQVQFRIFFACLPWLFKEQKEILVYPEKRFFLQHTHCTVKHKSRVFMQVRSDWKTQKPNKFSLGITVYCLILFLLLFYIIWRRPNPRLYNSWKCFKVINTVQGFQTHDRHYYSQPFDLI